MEQSQPVEIRYSAVVAELDIKPEFISIVGGKTLPASRIVSLDLYFFQTRPASGLLDFTYHILECNTTELQHDIQSVVYKTVKLLDEYLMARLERGEQLAD